jgi:hypothetical protein
MEDKRGARSTRPKAEFFTADKTDILAGGRQVQRPKSKVANGNGQFNRKARKDHKDSRALRKNDWQKYLGQKDGERSWGVLRPHACSAGDGLPITPIAFLGGGVPGGFYQERTDNTASEAKDDHEHDIPDVLGHLAPTLHSEG